jgi:ABC-type sugar transport system substrate-binding protein
MIATMLSTTTRTRSSLGLADLIAFAQHDGIPLVTVDSRAARV